uniref:Helix-turn-helix domain-containing protein n=1 Tax=Candidatus Nitrotoga fabula TaxID=2182327 RepID=A0A2X0QSC7_9PROT|nr:protein of unknown function [Candidatus Nitrotoga fabula]
MIQHENTVIMSKAELDRYLNQVATTAAQEAVRQMTVRTSQKSELWDSQQCADYLKISKYTWSQVWSNRKDAPPAAVMGDGPRAKRRWNAADVMGFAEQRANRK